ncbi:MAG TPA: phosphotransferase [Patescibacteria group bacterium]|nr:phosphotransferase [Patescibacteria group bacterium]
MLTTRKLLERIYLPISLDEVATSVTESFGLGSIISFESLLVGYEEVNSLLITSKGKYIVKIFSKDKDRKTIQSNVTALLEYYKGGIPVPKLYKTAQGDYLYKIIGESATYLIVMDYFDGSRFTDVKPTSGDKKNITNILSKIHSLNFATSANYDMWLTVHLAGEFEKKRTFLTDSNLKLIEPVVKEFHKIDYSKLTKSIVHFDLHRENVMKDRNGKYCILDLASTDYNYKIFDLATFMALFCTEFRQSLEENILIYKQIISKYLQSGSLNAYEKEILPLLIKATFASNLMIPEYLQKTGKDENPGQTIYYKLMGEEGLNMSNNTHLLLI